MMRSGVAPGSSPLDWGDVQGDILIGLPKSVQTFVFLEIADPRAFKSVLRRSIAHRATSARTARGWAERPGDPGPDGPLSTRASACALGRRASVWLAASTTSEVATAGAVAAAAAPCAVVGGPWTGAGGERPVRRRSYS